MKKQLFNFLQLVILSKINNTNNNISGYESKILMSGHWSYLTNMYVQNPALRAKKNLKALFSVTVVVLFCCSVCFGGEPALPVSTQHKNASLCI